MKNKTLTLLSKGHRKRIYFLDKKNFNKDFLKTRLAQEIYDKKCLKATNRNFNDDSYLS